MELGGKDAAIVCDDADIEAAAKHVVKGAFSYSGQRCTGAPRWQPGGGLRGCLLRPSDGAANGGGLKLRGC
jgi:hypothetical protein